MMSFPEKLVDQTHVFLTGRLDIRCNTPTSSGTYEYDTIQYHQPRIGGPRYEFKHTVSADASSKCWWLVSREWKQYMNDDKNWIRQENRKISGN